MHLAFISTGAAGHINPTLPLVRALTGSGHRVTYPVPEPAIPMISPFGATTIPLPAARPPGGKLAAGPMEFSPELIGLMTEFLAQSIGEMVPPLVEHFTADRPDAVCYTTMALHGPVLAGLLGVPGIHLYPSHAANEHYRSIDVFLPTEPDSRAAVLAAVEQSTASLRAFAASLGFDREIGGLLSPTPEELNLVFIPREFQYAGDTFDDRFQFIGPGDRVDTYPGPPWTPPAPGTRVLFVSLGTGMNHNVEFFRLCATAFADTDWHVAMAIGDRTDPAELGAVAANIELRPYFPQQAVLARADAFITHAGMNSVMESLSHRVPMVAVPQSPEQAANARRVEQLGVGRLLAHPTVEELRAAVLALTDPAVATNLDALHDAIDRAGGPDAGVAALERHLAQRPA